MWTLRATVLCLFPWVVAPAQVLVATIPVGVWPIDIAVNPVTNFVYVSNRNSGSVTVINGATNAVVATIPAGPQAGGLTVNPLTNRVFVRVCCPAQLVEINGTTNTIAGTYPIPTTLPDQFGLGYDVEVNPVANRVYLGEMAPTTHVFDAGAGTFLPPIPVCAMSLAVDQSANKIYSSAEDCYLSFMNSIDGTTHAVTPLAPSGYVNGIDVNPNTGLVYGNEWTNEEFLVIDPAIGITNRLPIARALPTPVGVNPVLNRIYLPEDFIGLLAIDGNSLTVTHSPAPRAGGLLAHDIAVNPATGRIYVPRLPADSLVDPGYVEVFAESPELSPTALSATSTLAPPCSGPGNNPDCPYYRVTLSAVIANNGGASATNVHVRFAYSTDGGATFTNIGGPEVLSAGHSATATAAKTWMQAPAGAVLIRVAVDPGNAIAEPDEANNTNVFTLSVP